MAMLLYSVIVQWYVKQGHRHQRLSILPWYTSKSQASFADMLARSKGSACGSEFLRSVSPAGVPEKPRN